MADVTAAPAEIVLGDKTFRMSPLTDADMSEIDNWLRVRALRLARESVAGATAAERREVMQLALEFVPNISFTQHSGAEMMGTLDGVARLLWQGIQHNHPDVTLAEIQSRILKPETLQFAMDTWTLLNNQAAAEGEAARSGEKKSVGADDGGAEGRGLPDAL